MRFGVREICEVVFKAKGTQKVGNKKFFKDEPVIYFDSLKTSSLEGAATTVYATGGRGNSRLIAWEGERTLTFNMEDALISPVSFSILSGAGLIDASKETPIYVHTTETTDAVVVEGTDTNPTGVTIYLAEKPYTKADGNYIYIMPLEEGEITTEPYIASAVSSKGYKVVNGEYVEVEFDAPAEADSKTEYTAATLATIEAWAVSLSPDYSGYGSGNVSNPSGFNELSKFKSDMPVLVDYYVERTSRAQQIDITPDQFGGNYYVEASTLWRDQSSGQDWPAEFIIPNCKVQSNFTFTMAASGDPSTFNFVLDAFPDYTRFNKTKKVLAAIQIIDPDNDDAEDIRLATAHTYMTRA